MAPHTMEHYSKVEVRELEEEPLVISGQLPNIIHMKVNYGSKIRNLMGFAIKKMKEAEMKQITWNGSGSSVAKAVSCAEIMKRKHKNLHQITKVRFRRIEEIWEPKLEGLERLKVNRDIPSITILLSKDPLDKEEPGYQAPGCFDEFWQSTTSNTKHQENRRSKHTSAPPGGGPPNQKSGQKGQRKGKDTRAAKNMNSPKTSNEAKDIKTRDNKKVESKEENMES